MVSFCRPYKWKKCKKVFSVRYRVYTEILFCLHCHLISINILFPLLHLDGCITPDTARRNFILKVKWMSVKHYVEVFRNIEVQTFYLGLHSERPKLSRPGRSVGSEWVQGFKHFLGEDGPFCTWGFLEALFSNFLWQGPSPFCGKGRPQKDELTCLCPTTQPMPVLERQKRDLQLLFLRSVVGHWQVLFRHLF